MRTLLSLCMCVVFGVGAFIFSTAHASHSVNINTADKAALTTLTGIGEVKAQAIIDYRATNGSFASIEDIQNVSGIGPSTFNSIKPHITVEGEQLATASSEANDSPSESIENSGSSSSSGSSQSPHFSSSEVIVDAGGDRAAIAGANVQFSAYAYHDSETLDDARFMWNFGDGVVARGVSPSHRFEYPGRYVVVVTEYAVSDEEAFDRFVVAIDEARLTLHVLPDGGIEIENNTAREADLSHWIIKSESGQFMFPDNSLVLGGQSMRIAPTTLGFSASEETALFYPDGSFAVRAGETEVLETKEEVPSVPAVSHTVAAPVVHAASLETNDEEDVQNDSEATASTPLNVAAVSASGGSWKWWFAAFGLSGLAAGAIVVARRYGKGEWDIIEE